MHREVLLACAPYLVAMLFATGFLWLLARLSGAKLQLAHVRHLHQDQQGGVQSLSFVLTLPLFVMILMFIVQLSQITIGTVVVEYAAFAAARSAMVWIPAETAIENQRANQIGTYRQSSAGKTDSQGNGYAVYLVDPSGLKYEKIHFAASMACLPICPSRDTGGTSGHPGMEGQASLVNAYLAMSPGSAGNTRIPDRLRNKLSYALNHTRVEIEVHHPLRIELGSDAPLEHYPQLGRIAYRPDEFADNEYGWQDQFYVTVSHDFALLPGPGRLLARQADARPGTSAASNPGSDRIARQIDESNGVYTRTLTATVRLNNEGQKSSLPYYQSLRGTQPPNVEASEYSASGVQDNGSEVGETASDQRGNDDRDVPCCGNETEVQENGNHENNEEGDPPVGDDRNEEGQQGEQPARPRGGEENGHVQ